ncbi:hypothetical protein GCM10027589_38000 [Actinocorallia lasiicapitis]
MPGTTNRPGEESGVPFEGPLWWEREDERPGTALVPVPRPGASRTRRRTMRRIRRGAAFSGGLTVLVLGGGLVVALSPIREFVTVGGGSQIVSDSFAREVAKGWGSAPKGGGYTVSDPSRAKVGGGAGTLTLPAPGASFTGQLTSVSASDVTTRLTFALPELPAGGPVYLAVALRSGGAGSYRAKARIMPDGSVRLSFSRVAPGGAETLLGGEAALPVRVSAGTRLVLEAQISGADKVALASRAWLNDIAPPASWQHALTDTSAQRISGKGSLSVWSYLSRSATAASVQVSGWSADASDAVVDAPVTTAPTSPLSPRWSRSLTASST